MKGQMIHCSSNVGEFKHTTLTDPQFVTFLQSNNVLVWGGDIRDQDAWSTAQKLQATTYPFVAFTALQPRRSPSSATSANSPMMTVLSRHAGLSSTTSEKLLSHLQDQLVPRVKPFLDRLRNEGRRREDERRMREEQDRAYRDAMNRDKERIERKIREEEENRRKVEEERLAEQRRIEAEQEEEERLRRWEEKRMRWRRYMRRFMKEKEGRPAGGTRVRLGIRLPDGKRPIHTFDAEDSITSIYAFVDTHFIPGDLSYAEDPSFPPSSSSSSLQGESAVNNEISRYEGASESWWGFKIALAYPRKEVSWRQGAKIGSIEGLEGGGQLVVEMVSNGNGNGKARKSLGLESPGDSDGYDTESDDE